jgi:hypothetical protein
MLDLLFLLVNLIPLPFWFLMIFLPRRRFTRQIISNYLVFIVLGAIYIFVIVGAVVAGIAQIQKTGPLNHLSPLQVLTTLLATPAGTLAVWTHMAALDLVAGHWIYQEAERLHAPRLFTSIMLILTLLLGPLGVFVFVLWRTLVRMRVHDVVEHVDRAAATITTPGM